jgi:hypothetical protein
LIITEQVRNEALIHDFEADTDRSAPFHHADHVRLAFAYVCQYPALEAIGRFSAALKRYAIARGKTQLYHETVTWAFLFLIRERMERSQSTTWDEFAQHNPDLLRWKGGILDGYYRKETLDSELARKVFVLPDKSL